MTPEAWPLFNSTGGRGLKRSAKCASLASWLAGDCTSPQWSWELDECRAWLVSVLVEKWEMP